VLPAVALVASTAGSAAADVDAASAAVDLYARMTARDLAGVLRYIPAAGFTEIGPSATSAHVLRPAAFEALFSSDAAIKLRAEEMCRNNFSDTRCSCGSRRRSTTGHGHCSPNSTRASRQVLSFAASCYG